MSKKVYIFEHVENENAGTILDYLKESGAPYQTLKLFAGDKVPQNTESILAIIIMGGPMNVDEVEKYPFLKDEVGLLKKAIAQKIPCLGICLGSQLIAKALGSAIYKAKTPEVGWDTLELKNTASDALFSKLGKNNLQVLQWHEDTFDLPKGAVLLASSKLVPNQAFAYNENTYGFQFHIEVNRQMLADWFKRSDELDKILKTFDEYQIELAGITQKIYSEFFKKSLSASRTD